MPLLSLSDRATGLVANSDFLQVFPETIQKLHLYDKRILKTTKKNKQNVRGSLKFPKLYPTSPTDTDTERCTKFGIHGSWCPKCIVSLIKRIAKNNRKNWRQFSCRSTILWPCNDVIINKKYRQVKNRHQFLFYKNKRFTSSVNVTAHATIHA